MEKHFCDICDNELAQDRVGETRLQVSIADQPIDLALDIRGQFNEVEIDEICPKCLIEFMNKAYADSTALDANEIAELAGGLGLKLSTTK